MFTSSYPDVEVPDVSVSEFLFGSLSEEALARPAVIDIASGAQTSYRQLVAQVDALAGALGARDVGVGTVMALLCPNLPVYVPVFHGMLRAGATVTTVNTLATVDEIEGQLRDAGATWAVTISALLPPVATAAARVGIAEDHVIVVDGAPGHPDLASLLMERREPPAVSFDPATHVAVLPYSSGTTGKPKGVMITHRNLVANMDQTLALLPGDPDERVNAVMPFFHVYGLTILLNYTLRVGAALVPVPRFDLTEYLRGIEGHRCTILPVAPPIMVALAKHPIVGEFDLSAVRVISSGAAPLDGAIAALVADRIGARVIQGYGMSELSPLSHLIPEDRPDIPASSVGVLAPNQTCRLVDAASGEEITEFGSDGWTAAGELWISGPNVMLGYLGNPEATDATVDADGFLHTGDIGRVHRDGYYEIVDRVKELIKYHGHQVAPAQLEALLLTHPLVMDAAVIGVQDDDGEEIPKAFVVAAPGADLTADEVLAYVSERVAPHEKVRRIEFIDVIPKSTAGKILRRELRAREAR